MYYNAAVEILKQISFISALLCGFSLTFLVGLLQIEKNIKILHTCIISTSVATVNLLLSTIISIAGIFWLAERPEIANLNEKIIYAEYLLTYRWSIIFLIIGLVTLLITIGLSGWIKSKKLGKILISVSFLTILIIFYLIVIVLRLD